MNTAFGAALKDWRSQRRMSQLDLGLGANVSARHISFLETGRSRPSRSMVLHLCDELDVPRQARNHLLASAGLAPAYGNRDLSEDDMKPIRLAVDWMLERHEPFPAMALDRHWNLVKMNRVAGLLLAGMNIKEGDSLLTALSDSENIRDAIVNIDQVLEHTVARLRTESAYLGGDPVLDAACEKLSATIPANRESISGVLPAFIPATYRTGGQMFSFFSTFSQFGTAEDIALSELKIELMFPANEETRTVLMAMQ